jgi:hypothetical protein
MGSEQSAVQPEFCEPGSLEHVSLGHGTGLESVVVFRHKWRTIGSYGGFGFEALGF